MSSGEAKASLTSPRRSSNSKLDEYRIVHFNSSRVAEHKFCTNKITTYLYSWWNFAPKILFEEFSKLPYMYFLTMTALQCIPIVSNTSGVPTLAPILTIMVCASAALKLIEVRRPAAPPPRLSRPSTPYHRAPLPLASCVCGLFLLLRPAPAPAPPPLLRPSMHHGPSSSRAGSGTPQGRQRGQQLAGAVQARRHPPRLGLDRHQGTHLTPHAPRLTPGTTRTTRTPRPCASPNPLRLSNSLSRHLPPPLTTSPPPPAGG